MVTLAARTEESRKKKCRNDRFFYAVVRAAGGISHPRKLIKTRCKRSAIVSWKSTAAKQPNIVVVVA